MANEESSFQLMWSSTALRAIEEIGRRRRSQPGRLADLIKAKDAVDARLTEPPPPGDIYRKRGPIEEYHAVIGGLGLQFSVDTLRRLVLLRSVQEMS